MTNDALAAAQVELEERMFSQGLVRADRMFDSAAEHGRLHNSPFAKGLARDYLPALAAAIAAECADGKAGAKKAHAALLAGLDPEVVAILAINTVTNSCAVKPVKLKDVAGLIGTVIHRELVVGQLHESHPDLYNFIAKDLGRRRSKSERHRYVVMTLAAKREGIELIKWPTGANIQVGYWLIGRLLDAGMLTLIKEDPSKLRGYKQPAELVIFSDSVAAFVNDTKNFLAGTMPMYGPCVAPPKDWVNARQGGFHTPAMRNMAPLVVCARSARDHYRHVDMPVVLSAVNALQRTAWAVNGRILDIVTELGKTINHGEIVAPFAIPQPAKPAFLDAGTADLTEAQRGIFTAWKRRMANWYTEKLDTYQKYGRFATALRVAREFRDYPAIYFVYFADSRGRLYPRTLGLNPQGSDLQKALLHFSTGLPVNTYEARLWFHVHGANKWGFDKGKLIERKQWVEDRTQDILGFAANPLDNRGWMEADKPLQFLAWCLEFADWKADPQNFRSRLPVGQDGSCSGIQHLSALMRDEVGGRATNLLPSETKQDTYMDVSRAATARMQADEPEDELLARFRTIWLRLGIERDSVKRPTMTTPYGVTRRTAEENVVEDYLKKGRAPDFEPQEYGKAATYLMSHVWPAIGDIVKGGRVAMDWLRKASRKALKALPEDAEPVIAWTTPSGFPATQAYFKSKVHRIHTHMQGERKIRLLQETDDPDMAKHANGMAPNFVHSMDASHMHLVAAALAAKGVSHLAMIHDDFGTHAAHSQLMYETIREQFVGMYQRHDPMQEFADAHPAVGEPPAKGTLDITQVLESEFFFS